jgi:hypothetical protein
MPRYRLVLLAALVPAPLNAQADSARAVVEGKVLDPAGAPIPQAEIIWQTDRRSVLTRADGSFSLIVPLRGEAVILLRRPGFSALALRVDLSSGVWRGNIVLEPGAFQLPDVVVSARYAKPAEYAGTTKYDGFFQRQKLGLGSFISRAQIEQSNASHTLEIFRGIPGLYVNEGIPGNPASADIRIPRCTDAGRTGGSQNLGKVTVWIDGNMELEGSNSGRGQHGPGAMNLAEMLARIAPNMIEMVEVYRGPGEIPGQFHWDGCAAIVIWTRYNPGGPPH